MCSESDLYATSVIALKAATGKLKWYYQMTDHDIYDWAANAPPTLIEVNKDGKKIPAIAQSTRQGYLFILDWLTGKAVFGDEERPVPQSDAPGVPSSPTQPYALKPVPRSRVSMTRDEVSRISLHYFELPDSVRQSRPDGSQHALPDGAQYRLPERCA